MKTAIHPATFRSTLYRWERGEDEPVSPLSFSILPEGEDLIFEARVDLAPTREISGFQRGLWEGDVAELFLIPNQNQGYLEFNFAAGGAWWAASFSEPRKLDEAISDVVEIVRVDSSSDSWSVRAKIRNLGFNNEDALIGNVCGIFGDNPRRYASLNPLSKDIDFHRPEYFRKVME